MIDIDPAKLPSAEEVNGWTSEQFVAALRHDPTIPPFNPYLRQLLHVGYKIAAQMGDRYLQMLDACEPTIARNVTDNLYERHLKPLFLGNSGRESNDVVSSTKTFSCRPRPRGGCITSTPQRPADPRLPQPPAAPATSPTTASSTTSFEIWLEGDHYKWRAMRANGVEERYCTGDADPYEKFLAWARTVPHTLRNPLYHWTHLELKRYFGIDELLNEKTAPDDLGAGQRAAADARADARRAS